MGSSPTRVSRVADPDEWHSKTHPLITGYNSPFYQGSAMPSFSPQPATTPSPRSTYRPLAVPSPVPTLSHGCKGLPVTYQASITHPFLLASSLSPQSYTVPVTPTYPTFTQPRAVPNPDDLDFGFPTAVGSSSLPMIHPPPVFNMSYEEECELTPLVISSSSRAHHP